MCLLPTPPVAYLFLVRRCYPSPMIAQDYQGDLSEFLRRYTYQPELTTKLDALPDAPFSQETINEIVLWKVNRYAALPEEIRDGLYRLRSLKANEHESATSVIQSLLGYGGVDLPMASTFLRFQNPDVFQIIDRHAYRAVVGEAYPHYAATPADKKVSTYFCYLGKLRSLADSRGLQFRDLDRILYVFDKEQNGTL